MREIDCAYVEKHDLVALYLAGKLTEADAEAFEAHEIGCDRCSADLEQAGEIRVALGKPAILPAALSPQRSSGDLWSLLAAVAAVVMIALGIRELAARPDWTSSQPVLRDTAVERLAIDTSRQPGGLHLSWNSVEDARSYVIEVFAPDGAQLLSREVGETGITIDDSTLRRHAAGVSFLVGVRALDSMGNVVARSEITRLPSP